MAYLGESTFSGVNPGTGLVPTAAAPIQPPLNAPVEESAPSGGTDATTGREDRASSGGLADSGNVSAYSWLLAWGVLLAVVTLINKTRIGHAAIYYALLLMLFFVVLSNYRFIQTALVPFASIGASSSGASSAGSSQGGVNP